MDGYLSEVNKERLKPAVRGSRLLGAEEGCLERASGMRWSVEVSLVAKALCKYNRASVLHVNALAPCQGDSLHAHTCTHTPILFFHQITQTLRNAVINFPIITTAILQILLLAVEFSSTLKENISTFLH